MSQSPVLAETPAEGVRLLRLNVPEKRNALTDEMREALCDALDAAAADAAIRAVVLAGQDKVFAAGADLAAFATASPAEVLTRGMRLWETVGRYPKPLVAAVRGHALGGGLELALACDLLIVADDARLGTPEIKVGIMPGAGGTQRLVRRLGEARAALMLLTGEPIDGATAAASGLATESHPADAVEPRAVALASQIASRPARAVAAIRDVLRQGADLPLDQALALERRAFALLFDTADQKEGMQAFLEKRPPRFTHR